MLSLSLECGSSLSLLNMSDWGHSPVHRLTEAGAYMVTAGTYKKLSIFNEHKKLTLVRDTMLSLAASYGWNLQAWAIMTNHYHFVVVEQSESKKHSKALQKMIQHLHSISAREVNAMDNMTGRKVWFQYWDTYLTYVKSYLARLNYVHNNPVHHKLVLKAADYEWCSARWFEVKADKSFFKTVSSFKIDRVNVKDNF